MPQQQRLTTKWYVEEDAPAAVTTPPRATVVEEAAESASPAASMTAVPEGQRRVTPGRCLSATSCSAALTLGFLALALAGDGVSWFMVLLGLINGLGAFDEWKKFVRVKNGEVIYETSPVERDAQMPTALAAFFVGLVTLMAGAWSAMSLLFLAHVGTRLGLGWWLGILAANGLVWWFTAHQWKRVRAAALRRRQKRRQARRGADVDGGENLRLLLEKQRRRRHQPADTGPTRPSHWWTDRHQLDTREPGGDHPSARRNMPSIQAHGNAGPADVV